MTTASRPARRPGYDPHLCAFHRAFAPELRQALRGLPLNGSGLVLDVPCGAGWYTRWLARRLADGGRVVAADLSADYLKRAARTVRPVIDRVGLVQADAYRLPFADGSFDLVWSAQSMISLPDPVAALRE